MSEEWLFPRITDFWEYRTKAVVSGAEQLEELSADARLRSLAALGDQVRAHARRLDDGLLVSAGFIMAEDLYKSLFGGFRWDRDVADYIAASAGVFMDEFSRRGFVLHYIIDNSASENDLPVMLTYIPAIFRAAGMLVTGPQLQALEIMEHFGKTKDIAAMPPYIGEGNKVADEVIRLCHQDRRSYVYLNLELMEADSAGISFDVALSKANEPGVVVVYRNQPPVAGTTAQVISPPGVSFPS